MTVTFNARDAAVIADPYPSLHALMEHDPVHWSDKLGGWILTRYDHIRQSLRDRRFSSDRMRPFFDRMPDAERADLRELDASMRLWAVFNDPPAHTRVRGLMNKAFTTSALEAMRPRVAAIVERLLDDLAKRGGETDFIQDFAYPLPAHVIASMLGVPAADVEKLKHWSDHLGAFVLTSRMSADKYRQANSALLEMNAYFTDLVEARRRQPEADVTTGMVQAEQRGDFLSTEELVGACVLLLFAGHETTTHLLGNGLLALLKHPEQMHMLRDDATLAATAIEEMLRWDGPSLAQVRVAAEDIELEGKQIKRGDRVFQMLCAANRDPRVFEQPDRFDIRRKHNPHLTFGYGIHFCIGAPLARLEGQTAFPALLRRLPHIELAAAPDWSDSIVVRGLNSLRISYSAA
ncbi:MAG: cytochrome P450 [Ferrovibrio sp.]|nr:cytochrome P450 [Ferrovibrio sp.]